MTQQELAAALGLHQSQISRYCRRGMPMDEPGARDWIGRHIRLTVKAPLYRRQTRPLAVPAPKVWTVAELIELAEGIGEVMVDDTDRPHIFAEGLPHLLAVLGNLARLDESAIKRVRLPQRCVEAVHAALGAEAAPCTSTAP